MTFKDIRKLLKPGTVVIHTYTVCPFKSKVAQFDSYTLRSKLTVLRLRTMSCTKWIEFSVGKSESNHITMRNGDTGAAFGKDKVLLQEDPSDGKELYTHLGVDEDAHMPYVQSIIELENGFEIVYKKSGGMSPWDVKPDALMYRIHRYEIIKETNK